jgi:hypothetical protein
VYTFVLTNKLQGRRYKKTVMSIITRLGPKQGDQIGRIFANGLIVYFGQFIENYSIRLRFSSVNLKHSISQKMDWVTLWAIFPETHLVPLGLTKQQNGRRKDLIDRKKPTSRSARHLSIISSFGRKVDQFFRRFFPKSFRGRTDHDQLEDPRFWPGLPDGIF